MTIRVGATALILIGLYACTAKDNDIFRETAALQEKGELVKAETMIRAYLDSNPDLDPAVIRRLKFEIERGNRIRYDYSLTDSVLFRALQRSLTGVTWDEFSDWQKAGWFDSRVIDGEKRFVSPSVSNLLFRHPDTKKRLIKYDTYSNLARVIEKHVRKLKELAAGYPDPVLFPRKCRVNQTITVKREAVPPGAQVRCWLPYPSVFDTQGDVRFISSGPEPRWLSPPGSPIRSLYLESTMPDSGDLSFGVTYEYTSYAFFQPIDPERVEPFDGTEDIYRLYTREEYPHEIFSDEMRELADRIVGNEKNPYLKGKRIYDWIADNIRYSYAREYSTLRNISAYCLSHKYGDCGQEAILFITLCRIAGLPARWQSGFMTFPGDEGMHDWTEIYIRPYGWLPVDPYMGIFFTSMTEDLDPETRQDLRDFYYGNIDHFRLVANKGHNLKLYPEKKDFRSETVDFQRGEVEWSGGNLYFDRWRWSIDITDLETVREHEH